MREVPGFSFLASGFFLIAKALFLWSFYFSQKGGRKESRNSSLNCRFAAPLTLEKQNISIQVIFETYYPVKDRNQKLSLPYASSPLCCNNFRN
jgi:hypothetical protein